MISKVADPILYILSLLQIFFFWNEESVFTPTIQIETGLGIAWNSHARNRFCIGTSLRVARLSVCYGIAFESARQYELSPAIWKTQDTQQFIKCRWKKRKSLWRTRWRTNLRYWLAERTDRKGFWRRLEGPLAEPQELLPVGPCSVLTRCFSWPAPRLTALAGIVVLATTLKVTDSRPLISMSKKRFCITQAIFYWQV